MTSAKPYCIAKRTVWEAYQQVKANRGAVGIDDEIIAMFEQDLSKNLYKLWNRMSSGAYMPPPVKQLEIPKKAGGFRMLGIPTVSDRIGQTVRPNSSSSLFSIRCFIRMKLQRQTSAKLVELAQQCNPCYADGGTTTAHFIEGRWAD